MRTIRLERLKGPVLRNEDIGSRKFSLYHSQGTRRANQDGLMIVELAPDQVLALVVDGHGTKGERLVSAFFDEVQSVLHPKITSLGNALKAHLRIDEITEKEMEGVPARRIDRENISALEIEESPVFPMPPESRILVHSDGFCYHSTEELIHSTCKQRDVAAMMNKLGSRFEAKQKSGMGFDNLTIIAV